MSMPNPGSQSSSEPSRTADAERSPQGVSPTPRAAADDGLLETVLQQTLAVLSAEESVDPSTKAALLTVARRYAGQSLVLEPIAVELVDAALPRLFAGESPALLRSRLTAQIAQTLMDDPVARPRLESLWTHLCGYGS
jgi:hypothetical protein